MEKYSWSRLIHLQIGRYAEYFVKMELTLWGFDVYTTEVDDRGIDFVIRRGTNRYYDVQVKSSRSMNYIFFPKATFELRDNLFSWFAETVQTYPFLIYSGHDSRRDDSFIRSTTQASLRAAQ